MTYGVNAPLGLVPYNTILGAPWTGAVTEIPLTTAYGTSLFRGDLVTFTNGLLVRYTAAGAAPVGVVVGFRYTDTNGIVQNQMYWAANTAVLAGTTPIVIVTQDPNVVFDIQVSNVVTTTNIDKNADVTFATAGSTATGLSGMMLDTTTIATTNTLPLHILGFTPVPGNVSGVQYANVLVKLNNTVLNAGATGV